MATASELKAYIKDVTKCPICLDDFEDPRSLPCLHTFCLKCLRQHYAQKHPGNKATCPVCRQTFRIPAKGVDSIQRNFFIDDLVSVRQKKCNTTKASSICKGANLCDGCGDETGNESGAYCLDCREKLCDSCGARCRKRKAGAHQVVTLGDEAKPEFSRYRGSYCEQHSDELVKMYCSQCKVNICTVCFAIKHRGHECLEIQDVAKEFGTQIDGYVRTLSKKADGLGKVRQAIEASKEGFIVEVQEADTNVKLQAALVRSLVDEQEQRLLQ